MRTSIGTGDCVVLGDRGSAVGALRQWRSEKTVRPHVKFGLSRTDFEAKVPGLFTLSDDGVGFSVGGGMEAGSQRVAFFGDLDFTTVDLFDETFSTADLTTGIIFKF